MEFADIQRQLEQLGEAWPRVEEVVRIEDTWIIGFSDDDAVALERLADTSQLLLTTDVGSPPVDRRFVVYEALLSFNALWRDNGGARVYLDGPDGSVKASMAFDLGPVQSLSVRELVESWLESIAIWRRFVLAPAEELVLPPPSPFLHGLMA